MRKSFCRSQPTSPPIYLHLIFAILQFEISSLDDCFFCQSQELNIAFLIGGQSYTKVSMR